MLNWIGDDNMLFFWLFLKEFNIKLYNEIEKKVAINQIGDFMIERTKYLTVQTYKYKIRILWFIKANDQEFCDFLS